MSAAQSHGQRLVTAQGSRSANGGQTAGGHAEQYGSSGYAPDDWGTVGGTVYAAAATGHLLLLTKLQEKTLDKHPKDIKGCTPLYYAAQNGHLEVCEYLIQKFEDNNSAENVGTTPL